MELDAATGRSSYAGGSLFGEVQGSGRSGQSKAPLHRFVCLLKSAMRLRLGESREVGKEDSAWHVSLVSIRSPNISLSVGLGI